jgi:competence protein ComEA
MSMDEFKQLVFPIAREHAMPLVLGGLGLVCIILGIASLSGQQGSKQDIQFQSASASENTAAPAAPKIKSIAIDIEGAVEKPGVYTLPDTSRIQDVLIAAGGLSANADRIKVSQGMNLAAKITDGGKVYIPFQGDTAGVQGGDTTGSNILGSQTSRMTNINTASLADLDNLPGIGQVTAQKIIDGRPYTSTDQLASKKIVKQSVWAKIKDQVTVN